MKRTRHINIGTRTRSIIRRLLVLVLSLVSLNSAAQITIGGSVYGGGNAGDTEGSTKVTVHAGDINTVFGGARQADVKGSAFVNIDGEHASDHIFINNVYGGNDIAGKIGSSTKVPEILSKTTENGINSGCNVFVRTTATRTSKNLVIGSLFGGGNGDYGDGGETYTTGDYLGKAKPVIDSTYLEILGGCIAHLYGGGNNATVKKSTTICIDNDSPVMTETNVWPTDPTSDEGRAQLAKLAQRTGLTTFQSNLTSYAFNFAHVFGGNNKAEMAIRPKWNLQAGVIRDIYSGGNQGAMTHPQGILLSIKPTESDKLTIENVFGGCRMADVNPAKKAIPEETIDGTHFPAGYAARVLVEGGDITNVYGGNDISGNIYGGNAVGIHSSIKGDVYGGGNGSYAYTDNAELGQSEIYKDFYYDVNKILKKAEGSTFTGLESADALKLFRPNAESVSLRVLGTEEKPTIIGGAIYCGGNSATLHTDDPTKNAAAELKIGSYVIADKVFLGNNGANMTKTDEKTATTAEGVLRTLRSTVLENRFNSMDLTQSEQFDKYMDGVAMDVMPRVTFDDTTKGDPDNYKPYTTYFGSFFCGGNVGSMKMDTTFVINFNDKVVVYDKVVGGCNEANVYKTDFNAEYLGGLLGEADPVNGNKLELNFGGLKIQPKRWVDENDKTKGLEWNTVDSRLYDTDTRTYTAVPPVLTGTGHASTDDVARRFVGGNIYGGCYSHGHVEGNVVINLNASIIDRKGTNAIFDQVEEVEGEAKLYDENYNITERKTGVLLGEQGMDVLGKALNVFGGGYGGDSEIWGGVTINLNKGYTFQIFGGGELGAIGKAEDHTPDPNNPSVHNLTYQYDPQYSTCINVRGGSPGTYRGDKDNKDDVVDDDDMAEAEFIYGGSFEGLIAGDTHINLGNGRIFNTFAGSCNADILGHTETYVGRTVKEEYMRSLFKKDTNNQLNLDKAQVYEDGFPWVRDHIYGGNDLGGKILNTKDFKDRVSTNALSKVYNPKGKENPDVLVASAYTEYIQGRVEYIFGGCYGVYDYKDRHFKAYTDENGNPTGTFSKPRMDNAFINFRPNMHTRNAVSRIYGAGQGYSMETDRDLMQNRSYVLIDAPLTQSNYQNMVVFGAGDHGGVGMGIDKEKAKANADGVTATAVVDLVRGHINNVYGASHSEGVTRRTIVNVPDGSTIHANNLFAGAFGEDNKYPCDVYEGNVNYHSADAGLSGNIFGGNNKCRRTLYGKVNVSKPVWQNKENGYTATVYGAGLGENTWSEYTEVNLLDGASVYEVYGGGLNGRVVNLATTNKRSEDYDDPEGTKLQLGGTYSNIGLNDDLALSRHDGKKYNTNVLIHKGATVWGYAYGGGQGDAKIPTSGDVNGTTYIALLGGTVNKDIYAAGTIGAVVDDYGNLKDDFGKQFVASATAYIEGGTCRNVYGGGWKGDVGYTSMTVSADEKTATFPTPERPGETHVIIGIRKDQASVPTDYGFYKGVPTIQRNAYSGGEGGAVFGKAYLTLNNGYIGYTYNKSENKYEEKIDDETYYLNGVYAGEGRLIDSGNLFGGGYDVRSSVDSTNVTMWGGIVRGSMHGGGEIATIGRGAIEASGESNAIRTLKGFYKAGKTTVTMYDGHVQRNIFGGGKGYNILGYGQGQGTLYTDGYIFGQTEVYVYGGEIGTTENLAQGYGNVFGGGDVGYVYSPGIWSNKTKAKEETGSPGHIYYYDDNDNLTEDCKVVIAPKLQVKNTAGTTINGHYYKLYDYVDTDDLNYLPKKDADGHWTGAWQDLLTEDNGQEKGVMIHNAVFGGGNVSSNNDKTYANATTVYGNTTAALYDVYHRDFITVGTEHTGGLYGGGNLSVVDGYRELNITNYGTDYYGLDARITLDQYRELSNRERAYFQLEYVCTGNTETNSSGTKGITIGGEFYEEGQHLSEEKYLKLIETYPTASTYWEPFGFCSIYAGRLLNTIQRADLCGVFGSRMVLQGAKDRVADVGENIDYTINRVGELSLNQRRSRRTDDTGDNALHGNYFGIYSLVNHLGNLTSDIHFSDNYVAGSGAEDNSQSFFKYKGDNYTRNNRNNGKSLNQVALASGVFLELTTEHSTADHKDYGLVSGVIELDLINVKQDQVGGGFVYAKNEHRVPVCYPDMKNVILSGFNKQTGDEAVTYKRMRYSADQVGDWSTGTTAYNVSRGVAADYAIVPYQTSGNFIHPTKRIIDDCYPINNAYTPNVDPYAEAHYWYVKGDVYIYDQKVSAYTGSANAYSKEVHLPLTITAASNGKLQLLEVHPNLYAYYTNSERTKKIGDIGPDGTPIEKVMVNNESESYQLNDVITWWDWNNLSYAEKQYFVDMTYINCVPLTIDGVEYEQGAYVMSEPDFATFRGTTHTVTNADGEAVKDLDAVFRSSNNIGHDTGYLLTFDMSSPAVWDDYYTSTTDNSVKISKAEYEKLYAAATTADAKQQLLDNWRIGPTFTPVNSGVYGQRQYSVGEIITEEVYRNNAMGSGEQAIVEKAYVTTEQVSYTYGGQAKTINAGMAIPETEYNALDAATKAHFGNAWICTSTVKLAEGNYVLNGDLKTTAELDQLKADYPALVNDFNVSMTPAYICSKAGAYGGERYEAGTNYSAIKAWCSLPYNDRYDSQDNELFTYNHDALDLLASEYRSPYKDQVNVEYQAVFKATGGKTSIAYSDGTKTLSDGDAISNADFENKIRNDQRHYTRVSVKAGGEIVHIANTNFVYNGTPYGKGQVVDVDVYNNNMNHVDAVDFTNTDIHDAVIRYYCYEDYEGVTKGTTISEVDYAGLQNDQKYFVIQGKEPTETTTLYVSRESEIYDVLKEKVYTVVYQYTYYEDEDDGSMKMTNELHVINVHVQLESGVPQIGTLAPPATVLPGTAIGLKAPEVTPGTYEVLTSGWELFESSDDADHHRNGQPFDNGNTPVYWYQNGKNYVSFYSKTYLGKTYSNPVPLSVANYHDLDAVMTDKAHHMYVDNPTVDRPSKIYIDNRECQSDATKSELDLLKDFFDLSLQTSVATTGETSGHGLLDNHVRAGRNLEFFLNSDVSPKKYTDWTPIGNDDITGDGGQCFEGNLHGDGHTVSGLSNSLFAHLCGDVYNLGVTGSFNTAGIADSGDGYIENSWVKTTGTPDGSVHAVFGNPTAVSGIKQVVNCYYPESNGYKETANAHGNARKMSDQAFYNGEVAYDLNGFYLNKRYYDHIGSAVPAPDYVKSRYADGDFRYAGGTIPGGSDERQHVVTTGEGDDAVTTIIFEPLWPDDYLFFGQMLNYGHSASYAHGDQPTAIVKDGGRLLATDQSNRVYRAPAYYGDSKMSVVHFNPWAYLAAYSKSKTITDTNLKEAYPGLTAVDFAGHNDKEYKQGLNGKHFFQPLLDDDGLVNIDINGQTPNLVVYAPKAEDNAKTQSVLENYLTEPDFYDYYNVNDDYRRVSVLPTGTTSGIYGHLVQGDLTATNDHLLVDKQDFNAPIAYSFADDKRMWYQRKPSSYVTVDANGNSTGWDNIALPFRVELVTTQDKGEISHFYGTSTKGHEYWLREFTGVGTENEGVLKANLTYPAAEAGGEKYYKNTFLWDYYYSKNSGLDEHTDEYQKNYYKTSHVYSDYAMQQAGKPYIIGLPGSYYYEFDLSGEWQPTNTAEPAPAKLPAQTVTYASMMGAEIGVTDDEAKHVANSGYTFHPTFKRTELPEGVFLMNAEGSKYEKTTAPTTLPPFYTYFTATTAGSRTRSIVFNDDYSQLGDDEESQSHASESVIIRGGKHKVTVKSNLHVPATVRVFSVSGLCIATFDVEPGETVEQRVLHQGTYIVHVADGRFIKKVLVK